MTVRGLDRLRRDQAALAGELRRLAEPEGGIAQLPAAGSSTTVVLWAKVTSVVGSDPVYGAHLVVQPQVFSGTPPTAGDSSAPTLRCYPSPNRVASDYSAGEYVKVLTCRGALVADKGG